MSKPRESVLEPDSAEFRAAAHRAVDWMADYLEQVENYPVLSRARPGEIAAKLAGEASRGGRPLDELLGEFETKILPGVTHWNHPAFFAYFSITGSRAGVLGEMLSAALNVNGMLWKTSPAVTELETRVLEWLRKALGLPDGLFGIINDTASINSFLAIAAAREATGLNIRELGMTGRELPQMRVYCSDQSHSSIEKAALALGFGTRGVRKIPGDAAFRMDVAALGRAIEEDLAAEVRPVAVSCTVGTTSTAAIDPVPEIGALTKRHGIWLHVDGAYAGPATISPRFRWLWNGIENADSIVVNPHKWLFTPVDCSVLYTKRPDMLKETFSLVPDYLKTAESDVINYMDYGLQLGRRFRALKLWLVLEHYGTDKLGEVISSHVDLAEDLGRHIESTPGYELAAPQSLSVVVFRKVVRAADGSVDEDASERANEELMSEINESGRAFVSQTRLRGRYVLRVAIGNG
ncbi:MAG: pyridoxal-dependent decarboxylase, partial [Thermoanaerobaculia bacterium]|nr:pyridoxal-dependent decarboxylase [Thermoanaerobaculia bacterium]